MQRLWPDLLHTVRRVLDLADEFSSSVQSQLADVGNRAKSLRSQLDDALEQLDRERSKRSGVQAKVEELEGALQQQEVAAAQAAIERADAAAARERELQSALENERAAATRAAQSHRQKVGHHRHAYTI
jgi:chromosome segregation ATPase